MLSYTLKVIEVLIVFIKNNIGNIMRRHEYESRYNPAATELSRALMYDGVIRPDMLDKITRVLDGVEVTDNLLVQKDNVINQKTAEVQSKNNLLVQKEQLLGQKDNQLNQFQQIITTKTVELQSKENLLAQKEQLLVQKDKNLEKLKETGTVGEQKEYVDVLHKLYPKWYPERLEDWPSDSHGKKIIDKGDYENIKASLPTYRKQLAEKEFIEIMHELFPKWYPLKYEDWPADVWGKKNVIEPKNYEVIERSLPVYKQWLVSKKELIDILPKLHPELYPINYEEWTDQPGKQLLDKCDLHCDYTEILKESLPIYRKQLTIKEFIEILPKLYPDYPVGFENWTNQWGKGVVDRDEFETIKGNLAIYKKNLLKKEFIDIMHQVNPKVYPAHFKDWSNNSSGKEILEKEDYEAMKESLSIHRQKLKEREKEQEISKFKELYALKEVEITRKELEKQELLIQKEREKEELLLAKELENQKLLIQKEEEVHNKSLAKNQFIGELQGELGLKEKDALNLKIESLMKQLEFKDKEMALKTKESELKDKALEDAYEIAKQKEIVNELKEKELADARAINELQGKLLDLKALYGHEVSFAEEFSAIQFQAENNIANNDFNAIQDLSRYISELLGSARENAESIEISKLLALNESPIGHVDVENNLVQNPLAVINNGNFDINNVHTTHSVLVSISGEESFSLIQEENFN